jgi:hypothetical protein
VPTVLRRNPHMPSFTTTVTRPGAFESQHGVVVIADPSCSCKNTHLNYPWAAGV